MKTLYLLRHAKSSWDNPGLSDHDRPLNDRGEKDAPRMGKRMRKHGVKPDLICSSTATRAITTARKASEEMGYTLDDIQQTRKLYHAEGEEMLEFLRSIPESHESVMLVGHNPGFTEFANGMFNEEIANIPTAGIVGGRLEIDSWKEAKWGCGKMFLYEYPKKKE